MGIDWSVLKFGKGSPGGLLRHRKRVSNTARLQEAYTDVDLRDGGFSVVSGAWTKPGAADPRVRREHHHLKGRRVRPDWVFKPERIITVTAFEHELLQTHALHVEGCDARKPLFFHWNRRMVPEGKEPFRIRKAAA
jgi:hypothetical protein